MKQRMVVCRLSAVSSCLYAFLDGEHHKRLQRLPTNFSLDGLPPRLINVGEQGAQLKHFFDAVWHVQLFFNPQRRAV